VPKGAASNCRVCAKREPAKNLGGYLPPITHNLVKRQNEREGRKRVHTPPEK
jgi:hypothetical protein